MDWPDTEVQIRTIAVIIAASAVIAAPPILFNLYGNEGLQAASIVTTGLLTLALVVLYFQQYTVLSRQTQLMEQEFESVVAYSGQITAEDDTIYIDIRNAGRGAIRLIYLRSEVVSDTGSLKIKPGYDQLSPVEGDSKYLPGFCDLREFKGRIRMTIEEGERFNYPFRYISGRLAEEGIECCTVQLTLEIFDETAGANDEPEEFQIAEQEVEMGELEEYEIEQEGKTQTFKQYESRTFTEAIGPMRPVDVMPRDSPHIEYEREE